jgi:hypothetical protein
MLETRYETDHIPCYGKISITSMLAPPLLDLTLTGYNSTGIPCYMRVQKMQFNFNALT